MAWRKLNRILHRDFGYFFFGMCVIYGLSGIALNHLDDWDPNYIIESRVINTGSQAIPRTVKREELKDRLKAWGINESLKEYYFPSATTLKIFLKGGSLTLDLAGGTGIYENVKRRSLFYQINYLHYNHAKSLWTWFADIFGGALILLAITGIIMLQGRKGLTGRGKWFIAAGILIPLIFLILK